MSRIVVPDSLDEALAELARGGPDTLLLAGGTDLMVEFESGRTRPEHVVNVWGLDELRGLREEPDGLRLGALTTCRELESSPRVVDVLREAAAEVGAVQIKNRATLGGNLGTASPAADLNPVLLALDAVVRLRSAAGTRDVPCAEFLTGYRATARRHDELIESVFVPARPAGERRAFRKVGTRAAQSISKVVLAVAVVLEDDRVVSVRAAAGSVAARTVLLPALERELAGEIPTPGAVAAAARAAATEDVAPIDDVRSTGDYRREVVFRLLESRLAGLLTS